MSKFSDGQVAADDDPSRFFLAESHAVLLAVLRLGVEVANEQDHLYAITCLRAAAIIAHARDRFERESTHLKAGIHRPIGLSRFISDSGAALLAAGELTDRLYDLEDLWERLP